MFASRLPLYAQRGERERKKLKLPLASSLGALLYPSIGTIVTAEEQHKKVKLFMLQTGSWIKYECEERGEEEEENRTRKVFTAPSFFPKEGEKLRANSAFVKCVSQSLLFILENVR